jgi:hypothetical protein
MSRKNEPTSNDDIFEPDTGDTTPSDDPQRTSALANANALVSSAQSLDALVQAAAVEQSSISFAELAQRNREAREMHNIDEDSEVGDGDFFVNMAKADEKLQPMAIGTRLVVSCSGAEAKVSASGGNPMIALRVKVECVVNTPVATTDTRSYVNRTVRDNLLFIPPNEDTGYRGTIWRANQAMRAFGVEPDHGVYRSKAAFMEMLQRKAEELVGAVCEIELGLDDGTSNGTRAPAIDPSTGEPYPLKNTIARYYQYKPVTPARTDDSDLPF